MVLKHDIQMAYVHMNANHFLLTRNLRHWWGTVSQSRIISVSITFVESYTYIVEVKNFTHTHLSWHTQPATAHGQRDWGRWMQMTRGHTCLLQCARSCSGWMQTAPSRRMDSLKCTKTKPQKCTFKTSTEVLGCQKNYKKRSPLNGKKDHYFPCVYFIIL